MSLPYFPPHHLSKEETNSLLAKREFQRYVMATAGVKRAKKGACPPAATAPPPLSLKEAAGLFSTVTGVKLEIDGKEVRGLEQASEKDVRFWAGLLLKCF